MSILRPASIAFALVLATGCDSGKSGEGKPAGAQAATPQAKDAPANPHGAAPGAPGAAANPHGAMPMPGAPGPHGGAGAAPHGMPPMMAPKAPAGPPRDITPSGELAAQTLPGLAFSVPKEWEKGTPSNSMRQGQWVLPGPGGDAELVVFRFPDRAGTVEANINRWKGQFTPPEGKTIDEATTTKEIAGPDGLSTTLVDVSGTFVAATQPGGDQKHNDPGRRMLAAIVSGSGAPFYFKAVGPKATMDLWAPAYDAMVASFAKGEAAPAGDKPAGDTPAQ